jgi:hypothetical protein
VMPRRPLYPTDGNAALAEPRPSASAAPFPDDVHPQQQLVVDAYRRAGRLDKRRVAALLRRAARARHDSVTFFSFCMREEKTKQRIVCLPHQRLVLRFVDAFDRCVIRMPVGASKTFLMATLTIQYLGQDPTNRGAIICASQDQAKKPLSMVQDYIADENRIYPELHLVFPELVPSPRPKDSWTQDRLIVQRPPGIRDPSLLAIGIDGKLPGSRLSWIVVDDILDESNTSTPANRAKVNRLFSSTVLSRRDIEKSKLVVTNTPWHLEDITYQLEREGWPTLTISIDGEIVITNAPGFDCEEIRKSAFPKPGGEEMLRLAAHDDHCFGVPFVMRAPGGELVEVPEGTPGAVPLDLHDEVPLWPGKYGLQQIAELKQTYAANPAQYNQLYRCRARDDESAACKMEWIQRCKEQAIAAGYFGLVSEYRGPNLTVTGVDLAIGETNKHDFTAYFTFEVIPMIDLLLRDGTKKTLKNARRILDVEFGRYRGRDIVDRLIDKAGRFNSIVRVETNASQDFIRQWTLDLDTSVPVRAHHTGSNKHHRTYGVAGLFIELQNGAWLIPTDPATGLCHPAVQRWIEECLDFQPPPAHTGDLLVASWLARAQAKELNWGGGSAQQGSLAASLSIR